MGREGVKADLDDGFRMSEDIRSKSQVLRNHLFLDIIYIRIASYHFRGYRRYQLKIF